MNSWKLHGLLRSTKLSKHKWLQISITIIIIIILVGWLFLTQAVLQAKLGREIEVQIDLRQKLEQENERLRQEIADLSKIQRLRDRALELGFRPAEDSDIEYIVVEGYDPNRSIVQPVATMTAPQYDENFAGWLQTQLDIFFGQLANYSDQSFDN